MTGPSKAGNPDRTILIEWIPDDDQAARYEALPGVWTMGGWFGWTRDVGTNRQRDKPSYSHTWQDYLNRCHTRAWPYLEALRADLDRHSEEITGTEHQSEDRPYVPLFDDTYVLMMSFRAWGDLMAAVMTARTGEGHDYTQYAWDRRSGKDYSKTEDIEDDPE